MKRLVFIGLIFLTACSHPYSEMKEGRVVGSYQYNWFGNIRSFVYLQENINAKVVERRYEVPDSIYWRLVRYQYGTYVKIH